LVGIIVSTEQQSLSSTKLVESQIQFAYIYEDQTIVHILQFVQCIEADLLKQSYFSTLPKIFKLGYQK